MPPSELALYYFESCPFCQLVLEKIDELNLEVPLKDIRKDERNLEFLYSETGKKTVPCLFIDGKPMHESKDIVKWLVTHREEIKKKAT